MPRPRLQRQRRTRRRRSRARSRWRGSVRLGAVLALLVGVNIYVFFIRGGTSIRDVMKASAIEARPLALTTPRRGKRAPVPGPVDDAVVVKGSMRGHLGLSQALAAAGLPAPTVAEVVAAMKPVANLRGLRPENTFTLYLDPESRRLRRFVYRLSPLASVVVARRGGRLVGRRVERPLETRRATAGGSIRSSLNRAVAAAGESPALVGQLVDLFSWDINWYTDPRPGDTFRIVVEKQYLDGRFYRYGRILAAEYRSRVRGTLRAIFYRPKGGRGGYYTPAGRAVRRRFLRTPLRFRRISSRFNRRRFHPVLKRRKAHRGVDFAAARGTQVWAAADGVVVSARRAGGAGNMVVLSHGGGVRTLYMHLRRFARGMRAGKRVRQRQVIGYVGSTGLATGPHLHYEIRVRGRPVDPMRFRMGEGAPLPVSQRAGFFEALPAHLAELAKIATAPPAAGTARR